MFDGASPSETQEAPIEEADGWRPIATIPREGRFLVASYAPNSRSYYVHSVQMEPFYSDDFVRARLQHAVAWRSMPPEPPAEWQSRPGWGYGPEQKENAD